MLSLATLAPPPVPAAYAYTERGEKVLRNGKGERVLEPQTPESLEVLSVVLGTEAVVTRGASLLLLYMRPHATIYVSSHCQICDLILLCMCVPSYYYVCVLMLQLCCRCVVPRGFGHVSTQVAPQPAQHPVRRRSVASSRRRRLCQRLSSTGGGRRLYIYF
jgi:hypothetical protein